MNVIAQEENCPEPKKKAVKLYNASKTDYNNRYDS